VEVEVSEGGEEGQGELGVVGVRGQRVPGEGEGLKSCQRSQSTHLVEVG
jgi:hypothetical protein